MNKEKIEYYAHTDPNNSPKTPEEGANWQKLEDHLEKHRKPSKNIRGKEN